MAMSRRRRLSEQSLMEEEIGTHPDTDIKEPYTFHDKQRDRLCLHGFQELYDSHLLFDMTLAVDGKEFRCHRALLASSSEYFKIMFTTNLAEKDQIMVSINGVDAVSMELVMQYLYTAEVRLQSDTVQNLLSAANLFQLNHLRDGCAQFMSKKLDVDNCIGIHFFAQAHECENLELDAWAVITENFDSVTTAPEFLELSGEQLIEVIRYDDVHATEEEVFEAVMQWLNQRPSERQRFIPAIFRHVRLLLIDKHYLYDRVITCPALVREPCIQSLLEDIIRFKLLKSRWQEADMRLEPRSGAEYCRLIVYTAYSDDEKKQVLQLYGPRSDEANRAGNIGLCDLPSDVENPSLLVTGDNDLYIAGGDACGNTMYKWVPEDGTFDEMTVMSGYRKQFELVQVDRSIYAVGGYNHDGHLSSVCKYSEENDEWDLVQAMPKALRCHCSVAFRGKMYVFGGEFLKTSKKGYSALRKPEINAQVLCYDPREDMWTIGADMPTPRALAGCTVFRNKIYVIGGFSSLTESWFKDKVPESCLPIVEIYDPVTDMWSTGPELPTPLYAMGVVKYYGCIYVIGGEAEDDANSSVYFLNEDDLWEVKEDLYTGVAGVTEISVHSHYAIINIDVET